MGDRTRLARLCAIACISLTASIFGAAGIAKAQSVSGDDLRALKAQIDALQAKVKDLESKQQQSDANATAAKRQASEAQAQAAAAKASASQASATAAKTQTQVANLPVKPTDKDDWFFRHKPGDPLTFQTPGGEITAYGQIDVSFDAASKTVTGFFGSAANQHCEYGGGFCTPTGNFGWMPDISTNISYVGVRGFQRLSGFQPSGLPVKAEPVIEPASDWRFVYQLEAGFDVSAFPSNKQSNSNLSNQVNGALFSRNSYIGLANPAIGAIKIGKEDTPYKSSTAAFNPFSGMWGDYSVVMGNTGGDNRVEFGYRASHAIWYESPNMGGWQFNALYAPGQNRSWISDNISSGESDCTGNNDPTSGAPVSPTGPFFCTDGSFSDLASANISYTSGGFYATAAGEWHHAVNRQSDIQGMFGITPPTVGVFGNCQNATTTTLQSELCSQDVADEWAAKIGGLYKFQSTGTTVGAIVEYMKREVPADLAFQNERTRWGTWVFLSQQLTPVDSIHFGWAHAFRAQGDPGQHNDCTLTAPGGGGCFATNDNQADMVTAAYKHQFSKNLTWYTDIAATFNGPSAHYDLGAGGRGVTTDCHDANDLANGGSASGGIFATPNCFTGTTLVGVSTGLQWRF
jgi:predicted porin